MVHVFTLPVLTIAGNPAIMVLAGFLVAFSVYWAWKFLASLLVGG
jgi:hypothetical protein